MTFYLTFDVAHGNVGIRASDDAGKAVYASVVVPWMLRREAELVRRPFNPFTLRALGAELHSVLRLHVEQEHAARPWEPVEPVEVIAEWLERDTYTAPQTKWEFR